MIAYVDSSLLTRAYLPDEDGHDDAIGLLTNEDIALVTGSWTRIEVSGALSRAARNTGRDSEVLHRALDRDLDPAEGSIRELRMPQDDIERLALRLTRTQAIRAMDAWHLACAALALPRLVEADEEFCFATRDVRQGEVARDLGFELI